MAQRVGSLLTGVGNTGLKQEGDLAVGSPALGDEVTAIGKAFPGTEPGDPCVREALGLDGLHGDRL